MLTMYWTVELDLRFCPQANGWMDVLMNGGMDGWKKKGKKRYSNQRQYVNVLLHRTRENFS